MEKFECVLCEYDFYPDARVSREEWGDEYYFECPKCEAEYHDGELMNDFRENETTDEELKDLKEEFSYCQNHNCNKKLSSDNKYGQKWGTCDMQCYADMVGVALYE